MATLPKPKLLPRVSYAPPPERQDPRDVQGPRYPDPNNPYQGNIPLDLATTPNGALTMNPPAGGGTRPMVVPDTGYQGHTGPAIDAMGRPTGSDLGVPSGTTPGGTNRPATPPGTGNVMGPPSPTEEQWAQAEADQNKRRQEAAMKAGNDAEVARLQAEWDRLAKSPIFKSMYGSADPFSIQSRLVNVYMNPNDRNPGYDFESAAGNMIADDIWAEAFRMATGRAPNTVEWDDHNIGRDPLEGHPEAIQYMKQRAADLARENQIGAQQTYQMLLDKNQNIMS